MLKGIKLIRVLMQLVSEDKNDKLMELAGSVSLTVKKEIEAKIKESAKKSIVRKFEVTE